MEVSSPASCFVGILHRFFFAPVLHRENFLPCSCLDKDRGRGIYLVSTYLALRLKSHLPRWQESCLEGFYIVSFLLYLVVPFLLATYLFCALCFLWPLVALCMALAFSFFVTTGRSTCKGGLFNPAQRGRIGSWHPMESSKVRMLF